MRQALWKLKLTRYFNAPVIRRADIGPASKSDVWLDGAGSGGDAIFLLLHHNNNHRVSSPLQIGYMAEIGTGEATLLQISNIIRQIWHDMFSGETRALVIYEVCSGCRNHQRQRQ
jgi:hypothetical protein